MAGVRRSRVPAGRLERLARVGWMTGEITLGGLAERARRLFGGDAKSPNAFVTRLSAERLARQLSSLRGAAMKLGQILSLEADDYLPAEITGALAILRSDAHAMPDAQLRRVLGHAYGKGWESRFRRFDMDPAATASIGQVHFAVAHDGRELALKIQYPGVARSIDSDVSNLASLLRLSHLVSEEVDLAAFVAETKRQLRREADYEAESAHLRRFTRLLGDDESFLVPRVHDDFTTPHILAMDFVRGVPLDQAVDLPQAARNRIGAQLYRLFFRELFEFRFVQTDPNFANYLLLPGSRRIGLLDFGACREVPPKLAGLYVRLFRAALAGDRPAIARTTQAMGLLGAAERPECVEAMVEIFAIATEPFRHRGAYDFAASNLPPRIRGAMFELTSRRGFMRPPPPDVLFVHRKLAGTFLLCARLGVGVDVAALLAPHLGSDPPRRTASR